MPAGEAFPTPFDLGQPAGQVLAIVLFLIPGLNCTWIVERLAGRTPLSGTERLFRAIAWSLLLYALASPWLLRLIHRLSEHDRLWPWEPIIGFSLVEFVAPVVLGLTVVWIRRAGWFKALTLSRSTYPPPELSP